MTLYPTKMKILGNKTVFIHSEELYDCVLALQKIIYQINTCERE